MAEHATMRDGARIEYSLRPGDPGKRIALVHSLALDRSVWEGVAGHLTAAGAEVLTYDARGHGGSDRPAGPYSVELFASDLADLLDAVGWQSARVAGASMGGSVALAFALAHPAKLAGLGLIDTTAWYGPLAPAQWEERAQKAATEGFGSMVEFQATRWFSDGFRAQHADVAKRYADLFLQNDAAAYVATCRMLGTFDVRARLSEIKAPTAIVVGEEDYAKPVAMSEALHAAIGGSTLTVIKGARHLTPIEVPERIAPELEHLLAAAAV